MAGASSADLGESADRCTTRLRAADGDDTTDDGLPAVLKEVARLAVSVASTGGGLYSWNW
ncbi:hypothetical protein [Streptomyces sp. NPDC048643]|uniref:hypothetical protein n=1 Tax=Streptomyces sp. NPDC048643 TaxID=3155637 RepID=UPI0034128F95